MRFTFCGDLDVPDWLLSELFVVSKISALRIKLLAAHVVQQALGNDAPPEKAAKLLGDAKLEPADVKAVVASLQFILTSAARYDVSAEVLAQELQQLGLPREHGEALTNALREGRAALQAHFAVRSLRLPRLSSLAWKVHEDVSGAGAHAVELAVGVSKPRPAKTQAVAAQELGFRLDAESFKLLHAELAEAKEGMRRLPDH